MLGPVQPSQERADLARTTSDITKMPDRVTFRHDLILPFNQQRVHLGDVCERAPPDIDRTVIAKMRVGREEDGHVQ